MLAHEMNYKNLVPRSSFTKLLWFIMLKKSYTGVSLFMFLSCLKLGQLFRKKYISYRGFKRLIYKAAPLVLDFSGSYTKI